MDDIIYFCISAFESKGFEFHENSGNSIKVIKDDKEYFWYSDNPYRMNHPIRDRSIDLFPEISKTKEHKKLWQKKCDTDMKYIMNLDEKDFYQVQVCTQNLEAHSEDIKNFLENYKILKVSSPMATRKSNIIRECIKQCNVLNKRVIMITSRRSLSYDIYDKYQDINIKHYQGDQYNLNDNLVVQFDSLLNFDMSYFDIVILDEVSSLMLYATSTYEGKETRFSNNLRQLNLLETKQFLIADAFIIDFPFTGKTLGIYNNFREKLNVTEYLDKTNFIGKILREARKGLISVSSNEKRFLVQLEVILKKRGFRCLMLNGDTTDREKEIIYNSFKNRTIDCDAILYSPTLTVGVSIMQDLNHHFHYDISGTIDVISSLQMIRRVRKAQDINYYIKGRAFYKPTEIRRIRDNLPDSYKIINEYGKTFGSNKIGDLLSCFIRLKNVLTNSHKYSFRELLLHQFEEINTNSRVMK